MATLRIFRTANGYRVRDLTHGMWVSEAAGKAVAEYYLRLLTEAGYGAAG